MNPTKALAVSIALAMTAGAALAAESGPVGGKAAGTVQADAGSPGLWYRQPAEKWNEAIPLGNGRLGAMLFGGIDVDRLQLNEESLWAGEPIETYPDQFTENLRKVQSLILDGKIAEADALGAQTLTKSPTSFRSYEPLADLWIDAEHSGKPEDYRRELDLETGVAKVTYRAGGVRFEREVFISAVDDVIAIPLAVDKPGTLRARIRLTRSEDATVTEVRCGGDAVPFETQSDGTIAFELRTGKPCELSIGPDD